MNLTATLRRKGALRRYAPFLLLFFASSLTAQPGTDPESVPDFVIRRFLYEPECENVGARLTVENDAAASSEHYVAATATVSPDTPPGEDAANYVRMHFAPYSSNHPPQDYAPYVRIRQDAPGPVSLWLRTNGGPWQLRSFPAEYESATTAGWRWMYDDTRDKPDTGLGLEGEPLQTLDVAFTGSDQQLDEVYLEDVGVTNRSYLPLPFDAGLEGTNCPDFVNLPPVAILDPGREVGGLDPDPTFYTSASESYDPDGFIVDYSFFTSEYHFYEPYSPYLEFKLGASEDEVFVTVYDWYGASARDSSLWRRYPASFTTSSRTHYRLESDCAEAGDYWTQGSSLVGGTLSSLKEAPADLPENQLLFTVPNVPVASEYEYEEGYFLRGSFTLPQEKGNCLWVSINGGTWQEWNIVDGYSHFNLYGLDLPEGDNTIRLAFCSAKLQVDYLDLSPDTYFVDSYFGHGFRNVACGGQSAFWLEAECSKVSSENQFAKPQVLSSPEASGGYYVLTNPGGTYNDSAFLNIEEYLEFVVDFPTAGNYQLQARINAPDNLSDSYYIRVNGGPWVPWRSGIQQGQGFQWNIFPGEGILLGSGTNTIDFADRENGIMLDKIYVGPYRERIRDTGNPAPTCQVEEYVPASWWMEAECASYGSDWELGEDMAASNQFYIVSQQPSSLDTPPYGSEDLITFTLDRNDRYYNETLYLFARIDAADADSDSYWVNANGGNWMAWTTILDGAGFQWNRLPVPLSGSNSYEDYVIRFTSREGGAKLDAIYLSTTDAPPADPYTEMVEAETGTSTGNWVTGYSEDASEDAYIAFNGGYQLTAPVSEATTDQLQYTINLKRAGDYHVFLRMNARDVGRNSVWVSIDGGNWIKMWQEIGGKELLTSGYEWRKVNDDGMDISLPLSAGRHTLQIANREPGTQLDRIAVSLQPDPPVGMDPVALPCVPVTRPAITVPTMEGIASERLDLYPNPAADFLTLDLTSQYHGEVQLLVYDGQGRRVLQTRYDKSDANLRATLNVAHLSSGVYRLQLIEGDRHTTKTFLRL